MELSNCATVLATVLAVTCWILQMVHKQLAVPRKAFLDWKDFREANCGLHVWEAKVSGVGKAVPASHIGDARVAVEQFIAILPSPNAGGVDTTTGISLFRRSPTADWMVCRTQHSVGAVYLPYCLREGVAHNRLPSPASDTGQDAKLTSSGSTLRGEITESDTSMTWKKMSVRQSARRHTDSRATI